MLQNINYLKKSFIPMALLLLAQSGLFGQISSAGKSEKQFIPLASKTLLTAKIDSYIEPYVRVKDFSGIVFIVRNNQFFFNKSYGKANYETNTPVFPNTRFRIASISKQFTAASILLLRERGKISLSDTLEKFIPSFPKGDKITVSMLLSHTSGVSRDLSNEEGFLRMPRTTGELADIISKKPLIGEPGEKAAYSNNGYRILAYVVEKVSGKRLNDFLGENFFIPLGMKDTGQDGQLDLVPNRANGYVRWFGDATLGNIPFSDLSNDIGSGGLYSSAEDLYKWDKSIYEAKILSRSTIDLMISEGYGIGEKKTANHKSIGHDGRLIGFTSFNDYYPDDDTYIIFLSNIASGAVTNIRKDLPAILFGEPYTAPAARPAPVKLNANLIDSYTGRYEVFPGFVLTAQKERDQLVLGAGDGFYPLFAESETKFFYPLRYSEIEFIKNSSGVVTGLKWREFGSEYMCKKLD